MEPQKKSEEDDADVHSLPADALIEIFLKLSLPDILRCATVNRRWRSVGAHSKLWRQLYLRKWCTQTLSSVAEFSRFEPHNIYKAKYALEKNWASARCAHKRFQAHQGSSVNAVKACDWMIATASDDASVRVWNVGGGFAEDSQPPCTILRPEKHSNFDPELNHDVQAFVFTVDMDIERSLLVSGGLDENIHIWDIKDAKRRAVIPQVHRCGVFHTVIHGSLVVSCGGRDSYLKASDLETQKVVRSYEYNSGLYSFCLLPEQRQIAGGGPSGTLRVWDFNSGEQSYSIKGYHPIVHLCSHGNILACADQEGMVTMYDIRTMAKLYDVKERTSLRDVVFDASKIVTCTKDNQVAVYSLPDRQMLARFSDSSLYCLDMDDRRLVCGDREGWLHMWDYESLVQQDGIPQMYYYCSIL